MVLEALIQNSVFQTYINTLYREIFDPFFIFIILSILSVGEFNTERVQISHIFFH